MSEAQGKAAEPVAEAPTAEATGGTATASAAVPVLPADHWTAPPAAADDDNDSALGDDAAESTASLTSTIRDYRTIKGRTYHSEIGNAQYWYECTSLLTQLPSARCGQRGWPCGGGLWRSSGWLITLCYARGANDNYQSETLDIL